MVFLGRTLDRCFVEFVQRFQAGSGVAPPSSTSYCNTVMLGPKALDLWGFDLGTLVSRLERQFDLPGVEEVHARRRTCDNEHTFGARRSQVLHLVVDIVGDAAEERALVPVGQRDHDRAF